MMQEIIYAAKNLIRFASAYWLQKCLKSMVMAMCVLLLIMLVRSINRERSTALNYYVMLFVLPMIFTGMSRLFYLRPLVYFQPAILKVCTAGVGYVYLGVMLILIIRYVFKTSREQRNLDKLEGIYDTNVINLIEDLSANRFQKAYLRRVRVYFTYENISPYSGGVIRPYIVLPRHIYDVLTDRERRVILSHELIHIKMGHILFMRLFDTALIYWWINPIFYLCRELLISDMEVMCDKELISISDVNEKVYASLMLDMIDLTGSVAHPETAFFMQGSDYALAKRRLKALLRVSGQRNKDGLYKENYIKGQRILRVICALAAVLSIAFVTLTSYPRYTKLSELALYNEELDCVLYDTDALRQAVNVADGELEIRDKELFADILNENGISDEYVYISFDGIMKTPGVGGGGNAAMINTKDTDDVFYLAADTTVNKVMVAILKII